MSMLTPRIHSGLTLRKIESLASLDAAWKELKSAIARGAVQERRTLGDQGGSSEVTLYIRRDLGIWMGKERLIERGYFWLPFGVLPLKASGNLNIVVQLNRPRTMRATGLAGLLLEDDQRDRWLCHTGRIGGGRRGIGRGTFLAWTSRPAVDVVDNRGRADVALPIARLGDPRLDADVAEFVHEVASFKMSLAAKAVSGASKFGGNARELEGSTVVASRRGYQMTRTHATVRNRLADLIEKTGRRVSRDAARDIIAGDPNWPEFEFEIKPSTDSQSFYTAVGQLTVHSVKTPAKRRVAVLPHTTKQWQVDSLRKLGIDLVTYRIYSKRIVFSNLAQLIPNAGHSAPLY